MGKREEIEKFRDLMNSRFLNNLSLITWEASEYITKLPKAPKIQSM